MNNSGIHISGGNVTVGNMTVNNNTVQNDLSKELHILYDALDKDNNLTPEIVRDAKKQLDEAASEKNKNKFLAVLKQLGELAGASSTIVTHLVHIKELVLRLF